MPRIKLLFLAANTDQNALLELEKEYTQIRHYLDVTPEGDALEIVYEPKITTNSLLRLCDREQPDVIHFAAHADHAGRLQLHAAGGAAIGLITPQALSLLFQAIKAKVKLVLFNACYSQEAANAIRDYVPFRIGTKGEIEDEVAIQFASSFYQALGFGRTISEACRYAHASVALTIGEVPPDEIGQLDENEDARATEFRLKSPLVEELQQEHRRKIRRYIAIGCGLGIPVVAAASIGASVLALPKLGWATPDIARQSAENAKTQDAAIAALKSMEVFHKNEISELGGDISPPTECPPDNLNPKVSTSSDELVPMIIKELTRKEDEQRAMDEWQNDILNHTRGLKEELLVLRSKDNFRPPYKSCSYILKVTSDVRLTRTAAFLVRDSGSHTVYRPAYRQMKLQFKPDEDRQATLLLERPRGGESLLMYLWVSSVPTDGKLDIKGKPWQFFDVTLSDMEQLR